MKDLILTLSLGHPLPSWRWSGAATWWCTAPLRWHFLKPESSAGDAIQRMQMRDASGASWLAVYSLQRQKDKTWRINGSVLVANNGRFA